MFDAALRIQLVRLYPYGMVCPYNLFAHFSHSLRSLPVTSTVQPHHNPNKQALQPDGYRRRLSLVYADMKWQVPRRIVLSELTSPSVLFWTAFLPLQGISCFATLAFFFPMKGWSGSEPVSPTEVLFAGIICSAACYGIAVFAWLSRCPRGEVELTDRGLEGWWLPLAECAGEKFPGLRWEDIARVAIQPHERISGARVMRVWKSGRRRRPEVEVPLACEITARELGEKLEAHGVEVGILSFVTETQQSGAPGKRQT
jgi:hypothetical protein